MPTITPPVTVSKRLGYAGGGESLTDLATELVLCPRCEARPRSACVTLSGIRATRPHSARTAPLEAAWRIGYGDALVDTLSSVRSCIARGADVDAIEAAIEQRLRR